MNAAQQRQFIRHPSSIPLEVKTPAAKEQLNLQLHNVSMGGLAFDSPIALPDDTVIKIKIPSTRPVFTVNAIVEWCEPCQNGFEIGVRFLDQDDAFRVRMVEQVCHIEDYRKQEQKQGRRLSKNKASIEWIQKHGPTFPR